MATDSTNLPQGETTLDAGMDTTANDLDLTMVQEAAAATEPKNFVDLPKGNTVILLPVQPGQTVRLPTDSIDGVLAKIGPEGNLALVVDGRTIILQGFLKANDQSPVKIVTTDGDDVNVAELIAATDPSLDIQTAAGPASGDTGDTDGSGIYIPFLVGPGLGGFLAEGILDPTALQYRLIDDERKLFTRDEGDNIDFNVTFDILGGIVNEDDLPGDQPDLPQFAAAKFVLGGKGNNGMNGEGNDPFDNTDRDDGGATGPDDGYPDPDREPLSTVATIKANFPGGGAGTLTLDLDGLALLGLKSHGELVSFELIPGGGAGDEIIGFIDDGDGTYEPGERLVLTVKADTNDSPTGEFHVTFTLWDQIDHAAPDADNNLEPDLLGANEQIFDLPVHFNLDGGGAHADSTLPLGVEDDIPFFGKVVLSCEGIDIVCTTPEIAHDETRGVDYDADDVNIHNFWVQCLGKQLACSIIEGGYELPSKCETEGTLKGAAKTTVHVSFGADGPAVFICDSADPTARNSIFGELEDRTDADKDGIDDGENEHPFELFMVKGGTPVDSKADPVTEGDLTIDEQATNTTVYWDDKNPELPVYIDQIDAHTIVGYVNAPDCEDGADKVAVFTLYIDDNGCMSFYQYHQLNHDIDGKSYADKDDSLFITDPDGNPLIYIRATDYDGDHAIQPVGLEIQDDGPRCCGIDWGNDCDSECGVGVIDEEALRHGIWGGPGDDKGGKHTDGKILVDFGVDKPGHMEIQELCVRDCTGKTVLKICIDENGCLNVVENCLKAIDERELAFEKCGPDADGKVTWTAFIADCPGEKVFSFTLDTSGECIGEFDFCLFKPLEHPLTSGPELLPTLFEQDGGQTSYEDNFKFDFKVRSYDSDGDYADCNVKVNVDDDSPDACKVEISFCDEDQKLVHDETKGKQTGGDDWNDPDHSGEPEDDTWYVKDFGKFEKEEDCLHPVGYAKVELKVDLSGGTNCPTAAFGADGPGSVSPVSLVTDCGKDFCGEKTNLNDTKTGCSIFLFTEEVCGETYVVGRVGGKDGEVSFALHVSDCGDLELAQYRAIQHPDGCDSDESLTLLDCEGQALIHLQVAVTDADGDTVYARQALDGCHGNPEIVFQDDGPTFCGIDWGKCEYDSVRGVGVIDEEALRGGIQGGPGDNEGGKHADGKVKFDFGTDCEGCLEINELKVKDNSGKTVLEICTLPNGDLFIKENCLQAIDNKDLCFEKCGPDAEGVVTWTAFVKDCPSEKVFTFTLDTKGDCIGEFEFCLLKPLEHPDNNGNPDDNKTDDGKGSFEDNFKFDFTIRATDGDGDKADASVCISVDDDSPDACKVDISLCDTNNKLVHDETEGVQDGGKFIGGDGDKDPSYQDEDDVCEQPKDYAKFEEKLDLCAIGYAVTEVKVDLSGGNPYKPNAAFGADGPGSVDVALVANNGQPFCGEKSNLVDTKCGEPIFLYTIEECGESFVVGKVGGKDGPIAFALHVSDCGDLELAQYRAIQHPDGCDPDESITLLDCNGKDGIINIKVTVTDADGDAVCVTKPLDGCHDNPSIVFQDDGPCVEKCPEGKLVLAMDETDVFQLIPKDYDQDGVPNGQQDGPTTEGDWLSNLATVFGAIFPGGVPHVLGAAFDNVDKLFKIDFGTDGGCEVCYELTILCGDGKTDLRDTQSGTCITLVDCGNGVVKGIDGCDNVVFAIWLDHESGKIVTAQFRAIDHGGEEGKPGAHDEIAWLGEHVLGVTATAFDKDGDKDCKTVDIGCGISFEDDGPKADLDLKRDAKIVLDESNGGPNQYTDTNANDENASADPTDIAYAKVAGNQLFSDNSAFGSDGPGSKVFSLQLSSDGTNSGLVDAASNVAILLYQVDDNTVEGRIGGAAGAVAFRIDTDPTSGEVTISQFLAVEHDNAGDSSSTHDESGSPEIMDPNQLFLKVTITDGDCDSASDKIDLGKIIKFEDDGPIARNDVDTVTEGFIQPATGNVISGVDGVLGIDENGDDGVADDPGTDGLASIAWKDSVANTIEGKYGTLTVDANGNYRYDLNEADADLKDLDTGESDYETFTYTITDKDGDTDAATLKIKVIGENDTDKPNFENENALVDEDGLKGGILNDPAAPTDDAAPGDDVGGHQEGGLPDPASEAIFRDSLNINWDKDVGDIAFAVTLADLADIHPLSGAVLTLANVSGNGTADLKIWDGAPDASNLILEVKVIDAATSVYEVQLYQPIQHTDPTSEDNKSLPVKVTATNDGGTSEHTLTIGIDDDRPVAGPDLRKLVAPIVLDESAAGTDLDGPNNAPAGRSSWTVNYALNFVNPIFGADGEAESGSKSYALQLDGTDVASGIYALSASGTGQGTQIVLNQAGNTITGSVGSDNYFTITVDPTNGDVTFTRLKNVWHANTGSDDDASTLTLLTADLLTLVQTVTDGDGDTDKAEINLGQNVFSIEDDGPVANDDQDEVTEGSGKAATGNVITGLDTTPIGGVADSNSGALDGTADNAGTDGLHSIAWTGVVGNEIAGKYGTLTVDANGNYKYQLNEADSDLNDLENGETEYETFNYTITDKDGDTDPAQLKIAVHGQDEDKIPVTYDDVALVAEPSVQHFNLVLIFDVSGSMNLASGIGGLTKLQAAKQAANNMLDTYAANAGDVRVMLVWFNQNGFRQETWLDIAAAKLAIDAIPASDNGALTNYETAILNAIAGFNDVDGRGDTANHDGVVYFLSDGIPTVGGNGDNSITDGTLAAWDSLLENAGNNIDRVHSIGLGTDIPNGANNPNLIDVADPDGNDVPANSIILVSNLADLNATLIGTVGTPVLGNIINGNNESDTDAPAPNTPDNPGDAPAHLSFFQYDSAINDQDIKITWAGGANPILVDAGDNGQGVSIVGKEVSFNTQFGKMLIDFSDGDFKFTPVEVTADKVETFNYKITDNDSDVSNQSTLKITIDDLPSQILIEDISVKEGSTAQITVSLTDPAPAGGLKLNYTFTNDSATSPGDYAAAAAGAFITIPAGQTSATITVNAASDGSFDPGETYNVVLSGAPAGWTFTDASGKVHIVDTNTISVPLTSHDTPSNGWASTDDVSDSGFSGSANTKTGSGSTNDAWDGEGGDDSLSGAAGNDYLRGGDNNDTLNGGADNDRLRGDDGDDVMNGDAGNDRLQGGAGFDKFDGGIGNDWIEVDSTDFTGGTRSIHGGTGTDVLVMNGVGNFSLTGNTTGVDGFEIINLEGGSDDTLSLKASDVLDVTGGNNLFIWGDNDDSVSLTGGGWTQIATNQAGNDGENYNVFQNGAVRVFVDNDIETAAT